MTVAWTSWTLGVAGCGSGAGAGFASAAGSGVAVAASGAFSTAGSAAASGSFTGRAATASGLAAAPCSISSWITFSATRSFSCARCCAAASALRYARSSRASCELKGFSSSLRSTGTQVPSLVRLRAFTLSRSCMPMYSCTRARQVGSSTGKAISTRCSVLRVIISAELR